MVGGMENLSFALANEFQKQTDTTIISWGKSQKYLPLFLPLAFVKALYLIYTKRITHIHLGDALLSPLGLFLKSFTKVKTTTTVCGLDITFKFPPYQFIVPKCVSKLDKVICISNATYDECIKRNIPKQKCIVIPCGIYPGKFDIEASRSDLEKIVEESLQNKVVLVTVGRLVKRKGVQWFIEQVLPKLSEEYIYLVIGGGPEKENIETSIRENKLENRVHLLGKVSDHDLKVIYNTSDIFIMPNIRVDGDMEGFGIVAVEATSAGLPLVGSNIEGITNAVIQGKTGILVEPEKPEEFLKAIPQVNSLKKESIKNITNQTFAWKRIAQQYLQVF